MPHRWRELHPCVIIRIAMLTGGRCADPRNLADGAVGSDAIKATAPPAETHYAPTISAPIGYRRRGSIEMRRGATNALRRRKKPREGGVRPDAGRNERSVGGKPAR
jgi:hypothetical protein